ncbi:hypothetical protein ES703_36684 [subsurface metagenome]
MQLLIQNDVKAITPNTIRHAEAGTCSTHLIKEMQKGVSPDTIQALNNIRRKIVREWKSKDPKVGKSNEAIKSALEMGIRHTLRNLLEDIY